jgi:hypothetical protein
MSQSTDTDKWEYVYADRNLSGMNVISPKDLFKGLELSRFYVKESSHSQSSTIQVRSIFIAHSQTVFFPKRVEVKDDTKQQVNVNNFVYAPLEFRLPIVENAIDRFRRITNADYMLHSAYYELIMAAKHMFLPDDDDDDDDDDVDFSLSGVDDVIGKLNSALKDGREAFAEKIEKSHIDKSRSDSSDIKYRTDVVTVLREMLHEDPYYNAGPTLQKGRLATINLNGDSYYLDGVEQALDGGIFDNVVYNVLVSVKIVNNRKTYFAYFNISRTNLKENKEKKKKKRSRSDTKDEDECRISFWIDLAMEYLNSHDFVLLIKDKLSHKLKDKNLAKFFEQKKGPVDFHCSIDAGCKLPAAVEFLDEWGSGEKTKYTQLNVPNNKYLPRDLVVGTDHYDNDYILTDMFDFGQSRWSGILPLYDISDDIKKFTTHWPKKMQYNEARVDRIIGVDDGASIDGSLSRQDSESIRDELESPPSSLSSHSDQLSPVLVHGHSVSPRRSEVQPSRGGIVGFLKNLLSSIIWSPSEPVNIITPDYEIKSNQGGGTRRRGRRRKLLKRTMKLKKSRYLQNKVTRGRGRGRGLRTRKN